MKQRGAKREGGRDTDSQVAKCGRRGVKKADRRRFFTFQPIQNGLFQQPLSFLWPTMWEIKTGRGSRE
jgi:hypothetical protein